MKAWSYFRRLVQLSITGCPNILVDDAIRQAVTEFCERSRILKRDADSITILGFTSEYSLTFNSVEYVPVAISEAWLGDMELTETFQPGLESKWYSWSRLTTPTNPTHFLLTVENKVRLIKTPENDITELDTISAVADNGSGKARFTASAAHGRAVNDTISHTDFTDTTYNGVFKISAVSDTTHYDVDAITYVATDTGVLKFDDLTVSVYVKPSTDATEIDDFIYAEYEETIACGAIAVLAKIPKKTWTDLQLSVSKRRDFVNGMAEADKLFQKGKTNQPQFVDLNQRTFF